MPDHQLAVRREAERADGMNAKVDVQAICARSRVLAAAEDHRLAVGQRDIRIGRIGADAHDP